MDINDIPTELKDMLKEKTINQILDEGLLDLHEYVDCATTQEDVEKIEALASFLKENMVELRSMEANGEFERHDIPMSVGM